MGKPTKHTDWTSGAAGEITEPTAKRTAGWVYQDYPAGDHLNWLFYNVGQWTRWLGDSVFTDFVTVGSGTYDDYATIALAVAASKNKIILASDISITAEQDFSLSDGVIVFNGFKIMETASYAGAILKISGDDNRVLMPFVQGTHTSAVIQAGIEIGGDRNQLTQAKAEQNGAGGTLTDALYITGDYNQIDIITQQIAGTLTNTLNDTGTDNDYRLIEA